MTQAKNDLIKHISRQFVSQLTPGYLRALNITSGYFNSERATSVANKVITTKDPDVLNRIFDGVVLDAYTTEQFYQAVMASQDPIKEYLVPLIAVISTQILDPEKKNLHPMIRADFKKYDEVRKFFTDVHFHDVMLRATASACLAMLVDLQTKKTEYLMATKNESDQLKARGMNQKFTNKISGPFDSYLSTLTAERFENDLNSLKNFDAATIQPDRLKFFTILLRALYSLILSWTGNHLHTASAEMNPTDEQSNMELTMPSDSPIELKINDLLSVLNEVLVMIKPYNEDDKVVEVIKTFKDNIFGLTDEIKDSREYGIDFEKKVTTGFEKLCEGFTDRIDTYLKEHAGDVLPEDKIAIAGVIEQLMRSLRSQPSTPTTTPVDSEDEGDVEESRSQHRNA